MRALQFVDMTVPLLDAAIDDGARLARMLEATVAEGWEGFPEALPVLRDQTKARVEPTRYGGFFFVHEDAGQPPPRTLVGMGGFKGEPQQGEVEIGYAIAPAFQNRGLATLAVRLMLARAFDDPAIRAVLASTLAGPNPSTRVLEKCGFVRVGEVIDPDAGAVWQWRYPRGAAA